MQSNDAPVSTATPAPVRRRGRWFLAVVEVVAVLIVAAIVFVLLYPSPIDPVAYEPPVAPELTGVLAPNEKLQSADILARGEVAGPEGIAIDAEGRVYSGTIDGKIVRLDDQGHPTVIADTEGRPLGLDFAPDGRLIVTDAVKGLLAVSMDGKIEVLATKSGDKPFGFLDDLDVSSDGRVYFSDASSKFGVNDYLLDMLEGRPHGRLIQHDLATGETKTLLDDLYFANGIALSQAEDFVVVNETYRYQIRRYWLKGDKAGTSDIWVENLPGFPDNISSNGKGRFWLALFTVRNPTADWLAPRPFWKKTMAKLPRFMWPKPQPYAFVAELDESGKIVDTFQDPTGEHLFEVTSAKEFDGTLYLGSLDNNCIGRYRLPAEEAKEPAPQ